MHVDPVVVTQLSSFVVVKGIPAASTGTRAVAQLSSFVVVQGGPAGSTATLAWAFVCSDWPGCLML